MGLDTGDNDVIGNDSTCLISTGGTCRFSPPQTQTAAQWDESDSLPLSSFLSWRQVNLRDKGTSKLAECSRKRAEETLRDG